MNKRKLGRTGISVSELCFGTMNFGWTINRDTAFALLDAYRASGGAFLQSIHVCPDLPFLPETFKAPEEWVGDWLRTRSIPRSQIVLSTRLTLLERDRGEAVNLASVVRRCCESSLRRIGVSSLDLLVCEWTNDLLPIDDALRAFDTLIEAGFVRHVAVANVPLWRAMEAIARSAARGRRRFEALQTEYSVSTWPAARAETKDLCESYNLGLLVTSALGGAPEKLICHGACAEAKLEEEPRRGTLESPDEPTAPQMKSIQQAALAWVLSDPGVSSVIISPRSLEQLNELLHAASWSSPAGTHGKGEPGVPVSASSWERSLSREQQRKHLTIGA